MTIATTILDQLGGRRFATMTGAKNFVDTHYGLVFMLPARFARRGINKVVITLTPMDTYTVTFYKMKARGADLTVISTHENVYAEDLQALFTRVTGLETRLF